MVLPQGAKLDELAAAVCVKAGKGSYRDSGLWVDNPIAVGDKVFYRSRMQPERIKLNDVLYFNVAARDIVGKEPKKDQV